MKRIFILIPFLLIFSPFPTFASKSDLVSKLERNNIKKKEKIINASIQQEKDFQSKQNAKKQSFEELKREKIIPDLIIGVDGKKIKDQEIDKLINKLNDLNNQGKKIDYFTDHNLVGVYIYLYGSEDKYKELKEQLVSESIKISPNRKLVKQYTPNDSYYQQQWNLSNINWSSAMDIGAGSNPVTIGIIDNGVDVDDFDLSSNIWQNSGEIYADNTDNDGNGYIDDKYGCNFYMRIIEGYQYIPCKKGYIKEDLILDSKHGTYVSQVAAGMTNNSLGIAGVCPNCKIAVLKITDDYGNGYFSLLPFVFSYATDKNFKILNLSYASSCPFDSSEDIYASDINLLINTYGIMLVQAAGNKGAMTQSECISQCGSSNSYCYSSARNQAYYYVEGKNVPNKINVAAINSSNQRASFSSYDGSNSVITIAAPGVAIPVFPYSLKDGTSFSTAMVSGALGVYLSLNFPYSIDSSKIYNDLVSVSSYLPDASISRKKLNLFTLISQTKAYNLDYNTIYLPISRFWSDAYKGHLYATGDEAKHIIRDYPETTWRYEGIVYHAIYSQIPNVYPVYRFWSDTYRSHFYTQNEDEKNYVISHYPTRIWRYEMIVFYAYLPNTPGKLNVYRFWSDKFKKHFYAAGESERDQVMNNPDWRYEQPAWSLDLR